MKNCEFNLFNRQGNETTFIGSSFKFESSTEQISIMQVDGELNLSLINRNL